MRKKEKGFTLVELLAVIVVLALILVIAIPTIITTLRGAQKESFFLYAQNIQSKALAQYTQDLEHDSKKTDCAVYDIGTDLGLSNVGDYEGWIRVNRVPIESGKKKVELSLSDTQPLQYVKYCVAEGTTCQPTLTYSVKENAKSTKITRNLSKGEVLCANYQYLEGKTLKTKATTCKTYANGEDVVDTYDYNVTITMKDNNYAVQDVLFNKDMSMDKFYAAIAKFREDHKDAEQKMAIKAPTCDAGNIPDKGNTTKRPEIPVSPDKTTERPEIPVSPDKPTERPEIPVSPDKTTERPEIPVSPDKPTERPEIPVSPDKTTEKPNVTVKPGTTTSRPGVIVDTTTTKNRPTQPATTTTQAPVDNSLLLKTLKVSGYDAYIGFSPYKKQYYLNVPNDVLSLNISATAANPEVSSVYVAGNENFNVGTNVVVVTVFNEINGDKAYYRINVKRYKANEIPVNTPGGNKPPIDPGNEEGKPDPTLKSSDASLSHLSISGYSVDFNPDVYEYTITTLGEPKLFVNYRTTSDTAIAAVSGNDELRDGDHIIIFVQSENGYYHKTYTIKVKFNKPVSNTTKLFRGIAIGLGVLLLIIIIILTINKRKKVVITSERQDVV